MGYHTNSGIVTRLYGCCTLRASEQRDLTEMLSRIECAHEALLPILILDIALALTLCDDVKVIGCLALLDFDLLWLAHHELNLRDDVVLDFRV